MKRQKNVNKFLSKAILALGAGVMLLSACKEDETNIPDTTTGTITVSDQTLSQNKVIVSNVNLDQKGWVVVHANTAEGEPVVPGIISEPILVEAGSIDNLELTLTDIANLSDGDKLWVMLHTDDGTEGTYEFDGANGFDAPITTEAGDIIMSQITVSAPSISVEDQPVSANKVVISEVNAAVDGWLVIHSGEASGPVIGQTMVTAGINSNVEVDLGENSFSGGEMLFPMLHIESPADGEYGFPDNGDGPEVFGENVIVVGFETLALSGTIVAEDQIVQGNKITVAELTVNAAAWVVVHASNAANDGPQVPGIISTPIQLQAGTTTNVEIEIDESNPLNDGDVVYIMLHTDNGIIGEYEFDGANGLDGPITTQAITVSISNAINYNVVNDGVSTYLFSGNGLNQDSNPDITLTRGETYTFTINASGHPFYINSVQSTGTSNAYNDGVENNGAQSGTITFTVPANAPSTLFYNCEFHSSMTGTFTIID